MNINIAPNNQYCFQKSHPNFKAIPLSKYKSPDNDVVSILQLENPDIPAVKRFIDKLPEYLAEKNINDYSRKQVITESFDMAVKVLESPQEKKSKILLAVSNHNPCGILIGNVLKKTSAGNLVYSSRKNSSSTETELDWLSTWNGQTNKKMRGVGKMIVNEFFSTLKQDGFKKVYVRSEIPEHSFATSFYRKMGFSPLTAKYQKIQTDSTNKYVIDSSDVPTDDILPMLAKNKSIKQVVERISDAFERRELPHDLVSLDNIL